MCAQNVGMEQLTWTQMVTAGGIFNGEWCPMDDVISIACLSDPFSGGRPSQNSTDSGCLGLQSLGNACHSAQAHFSYISAHAMSASYPR